MSPSKRGFLRQRILDAGLSRSTAVDHRSSSSKYRLVVLDGFLLYSESVSSLRGTLDVSLFLRTDYATAKARREARGGYVTRLDHNPAVNDSVDNNEEGGRGSSGDSSENKTGHWMDPPGYVDRVVWPNYVRDHAFLFQNGDVEGSFDTDMLKRKGIRVIQDSEGKNDTHGRADTGTAVEREMSVPIDEILDWAVTIILEEMRQRAPSIGATALEKET